MDVARLREQIPTTSRMTYMNTGWDGPSPVSVVEAVRARLEYESYNGPTSPDVMDGSEEIDRRAKEAVAGLLNASPDEVLLTPNTTEGLNVVMNGLPWREGDEIITCDLEHPSILLPSYSLQARRGVNVTVLSIAPDQSRESILARVEDALTDRTRMVFFSHIEYSCGLRMPVEQIRALTRPREIWMLLDGAQTAGHISIDVRKIDCDFYSISGQKWLLGPDETGALFVREAMIPQIEPMRVGMGFATAFDRAGGYTPDRDTIDKFLVSTASAPLRAGFAEAIRFVKQVGIPAIEKRNLALASALKSALSEIPGVTVLSPIDGPGCSGLVSFAIDGADHEEARAELWERHRIVIREVKYPPSLRASLDFFNTEDEVAKLVEAVAELARGG